MTSTQSTDGVLERLASGKIPVTGRDGQTYLMRPIRPTDAPSLMRGYDAMSDTSKWFRMLHRVPHLTEATALAFCSPDPASEFCIVVEGLGALEGEILGGARIVGAPSSERAEFSVSMRPEAQGLGLARTSLAMALGAASEMGYTNVWGSIAARNMPMLALARQIGFTIRRDPDEASLMYAEIDV